MKDKKELSKQDRIKQLSKKSQLKLEEIRQQQNFKTIEEAYDYLMKFTQQK
ncbi:hypothetical protein [Companilactobacillus kimchiensis]|uniref:Uncharacterized protein n=1 Tax=Companilactobacillus kimchiensis TaxID=993692 RepID=A0A0R2LLN1_9LACO|nr:hypothetical protein [Companilactobacillus kimchiensis]KRO00795.1 hypothetical protein IV57_GL000115 [Companilactobacillus kimchiensis]